MLFFRFHPSLRKGRISALRDKWPIGNSIADFKFEPVLEVRTAIKTGWESQI